MYFSICVLSFIAVITSANGTITGKEYVLMPPLFHLDNFDNCWMLGEEGLFCTATIQLSPLKHNTSKVWKIIEEVISDYKNYRHDRLRHGICVPFSCPHAVKNISSYISNTTFLKSEISKCYTEKYKDLGLTALVTELKCQVNESLYEIDEYDIIIGACLLVLLVIVVYASFYEGLARYKTKEEYSKITTSKYGKYITCFSITRNWDKLRAASTINDTEIFLGFNGMRFYLIILVVLTHSTLLTSLYTINPESTETIQNDQLRMMFANGGCTMQTFLIISAWLLSYHFFSVIEGNKNFRLSHFVMMFIYRYIRLTPCILVVVALNATWLRHMNTGPLWYNIIDSEYKNCKSNWWTNVLYINNYYNVEHMCLLQTWYTAADTQLFAYSLVVLAIVWTFKKHTMKIFAGSFIIGLIIPGVLNYINNYDYLPRIYPENFFTSMFNVPEWTHVEIAGHTSISGTTVGLFSGYIVHKYKDKKLTLKKRYVFVWWILVWGFLLSAIFSGSLLYTYPAQSRLGAAVYVAVNKNLFVIGVCLMLLGITQNIGWIIRDALQWQPMQILAKLTYCIFLMHVSIVRLRVGESKSLNYSSNYKSVIEKQQIILL
ncbi:hypothetical protein FQA39_LY10722 [Lamprigera yunnana]|nr:hypothetical protein FQA39_LY10722 [Lamprigera yunnana]